MHKSFALAFLAALPAFATTVFGPDPNSPNYLAPGGTVVGGVNLDGVVRISSGVGCSGALLEGGQYVVTAAHCVDAGVLAGDVTVFFETAGGSFSVGVITISISPGWTGSPLDGNDLAILTLSAPVVGVNGYALYTGSAEVGSVLLLSGFGQSGVGVADPTNYPFGTRRFGFNLADALVGTTGNILLGDFDDLTAEHDAIGTLEPSLADLGLGLNEVMTAPGDSGGPSFLNGFLVGIHSFRMRVDEPGLPDVDSIINSSFGELFGDTRISSQVAFIESVMAPEPGSFVMLALGLAAIGFRANRLRARR